MEVSKGGKKGERVEEEVEDGGRGMYGVEDGSGRMREGGDEAGGRESLLLVCK